MSWWIPFLSLLHREVSRFLKVTVQTVLTPLISSSLYLLVFGVSLGSSVQMHNDIPYLAFLLPGLMMMGALNNAYQNSGSSIVIMKFTGEMEEIRSTPLTVSQIIWAMSFGSVIRGAIVGLVTYLVGLVFYWFMYGSLLPVAHPIYAIFFLIMAGLVFGNMGIASAMWAKNFDQMSAISTFILLPLTYLGGVFISVEKLGPFWRFLSELNPIFYFINGIRHGLLGISDVNPIKSVLVVCASLLLMHAIAFWTLKTGNFKRW